MVSEYSWLLAEGAEAELIATHLISVLIFVGIGQGLVMTENWDG
ncbi:hypothetical protein [Oceanobacillus alkalisoli]|nr:hypothetical protein [Oceanobacillus alkalisoli]